MKFFREETHSDTAETPELSESQIIERVVELQRFCNEYVHERSPEKLLDLYRRKLLKIGKNPQGKIVATLCETPLDSSKADFERGQMFHVGGLATTKTRESTRVLIGMLRELSKEMQRLGTGIVTSTKNSVLARHMLEMGLQEMSPQELLSRYPGYLDLFCGDTGRTREYYLDQGDAKRFYVSVPESAKG